MNRVKQAFEALKATYHRTSPITTRGSKCGPNPWQQQHNKARDTLRSATKGDRTFTSTRAGWQNDDAYRTSQLARNWSDAWVRYLHHLVHVGFSHNAPSWQRERHANLIHLRSLVSHKQAGPLVGATRISRSKKGTRKSSKGRRASTSSLQSSK